MSNTIPVQEQTLVLKTMLEAQRAACLRDGPPTGAQRKEALGRLRQLLIDHQEEVATSIDHDYGHRSRHETLLGENFVTVESIKHTIRHLNAWMKPERRSVPLQFWPRARKSFSSRLA
jgi:coniferyl-aldehyde dehydrogenase